MHDILQHGLGLLSVPVHLLQMFFTFMLGLLTAEFVIPGRPKEPYGYVGGIRPRYYDAARCIFCYGMFMIITFAVGYTALLFAPPHIAARITNLPQTLVCNAH